MAIVQNPIIGRAKGQAGGVVFTTLNGQNVMKAKPNSYRDANTTTQQANRSLHTDIVRMAASIKADARKLFEKQPSDMPAFSKLVQQLSAAVDRSGAQPVFDPTGITIGSGSVDLDVVNDSASAPAGKMALTWSSVSLDNPFDQSLVSHAIIIDTVAKRIAIVKADDDTNLDNDDASFTLPAGFTKANCKIALTSSKLKSGADLQKVVK